MTNTVEHLEQQLAEVQTVQAFQDDTLEAMQTTLAQQHQEIQLLQKQIEVLSNYIKTLREEVIRDPSQEIPPPHY